MKRGPKPNSQMLKDVFSRMTAAARLAMEFHYGTKKKPTISLKKKDDSNIRSWAKEKIGEMLTSFPLYVWYNKGKKASEKINPTPWAKLKKLHRQWPHKTIEIGLAKNMQQSIEFYDSPNISADKATKVLRGFSGTPPKAEDAFYTLLKLKISPEKVWPDELKTERHLIYLMALLQNFFAYKQSIELTAHDALRFQIIAEGKITTSQSELGRGIEKFLKPLFEMITASVNGKETFLIDVVNPQTGMALFVPHNEIAAKIQQKDGSYKIISWKEIESILDE